MSAALPGVDKTVRELAELCGGEAVGALELRVEGAAGLREAGPADISFLGNPKYGATAAASRAGCLLLPRAAQGLAAIAPARIFVDDPQWAFAQVLALIESRRAKTPPALDPKADIHYKAVLGPNVSIGPFSVIERGVAVGEGTVIGPQCYVGENARVGRFCKIYPQVVIRENCVVGDRAIIHSGAVIGSDGFGFSTDPKTGKHRKIPQLGNVVIKDDVEIGSNVSIDRATVGSTEIGSNTKIDNLVQIAHNVKVGSGCFLVSQCGIAGSTELGNFVVLAGQVGLVGHIKIGDGVQIGAQSGIMSDVEKGTKMFGYPARPHREALKLQALYGRLPELFEAVKQISERLGLRAKASATQERE